VKGAGGLNPLADTQQFIQYATAIAYGEAGGAHNVWLQIWYAIGLAGLVGYALIALAPVAAALVIVREGNRQTSMYAVALLAAYAVLLFSGLLYSTVFDRQVWLVPALILALWVHRRNSAWQ
jgi:O-antigen ligase